MIRMFDSYKTEFIFIDQENSLNTSLFFLTKCFSSHDPIMEHHLPVNYQRMVN
ncbi:hypothetical protein M153_1304000439 [Pseudoloma neurophilia]|uniref:Uncharacterized protein n=1 Tax=Pseudoloma neurophilia TaxID=146866 RepID=A0A0R0LUY1_9MICR|nr:hypothetical protein M153_1304000439 [Pseudoloma neurophilia]